MKPQMNNRGTAGLCFPSALSYHVPPCISSHRRRQQPLPSQGKHLKLVSKSNNHMDSLAALQRYYGNNQFHAANKLLLKIKSEGITTDNFTLSSLMLCYANNGLLPEAVAIFDDIASSCYVLDVDVVSRLVEIYAQLREFNMVDYVLCRVKVKDIKKLQRVLSQVVVSLGRRGEIELMELMLEKMESMGVRVDSVSANAYVICYSVFGSLSEMEVAYGRLKRSRILIEEEAIRAMASAYIREEKFYSLGKFVEDVGLGRKNTGNLLWNLLILSYAAKFKMKSMQREFVRMVERGFKPDLTTFNIRAMAFSKMLLFWDLHLSIEHMKYEGVVPDLVTYGCAVDAYLERRLGQNLDFVLNRMNANNLVILSTDPLVFEAMGKGDFLSSSGALLDFAKKKNWTYEELIAIYLKKTARRDQIFWNY